MGNAEYMGSAMFLKDRILPDEILTEVVSFSLTGECISSSVISMILHFDFINAKIIRNIDEYLFSITSISIMSPGTVHIILRLREVYERFSDNIQSQFPLSLFNILFSGEVSNVIERYSFLPFQQLVIICAFVDDIGDYQKLHTKYGNVGEYRHLIEPLWMCMGKFELCDQVDIRKNVDIELYAIHQKDIGRLALVNILNRSYLPGFENRLSNFFTHIEKTRNVFEISFFVAEVVAVFESSHLQLPKIPRHVQRLLFKTILDKWGTTFMKVQDEFWWSVIMMTIISKGSIEFLKYWMKCIYDTVEFDCVDETWSCFTWCREEENLRWFRDECVKMPKIQTFEYLAMVILLQKKEILSNFDTEAFFNANGNIPKGYECLETILKIVLNPKLPTEWMDEVLSVIGKGKLWNYKTIKKCLKEQLTLILLNTSDLEVLEDHSTNCVFDVLPIILHFRQSLTQNEVVKGVLDGIHFLNYNLYRHKRNEHFQKTVDVLEKLLSTFGSIGEVEKEKLLFLSPSLKWINWLQSNHHRFHFFFTDNSRDLFDFASSSQSNRLLIAPSAIDWQPILDRLSSFGWQPSDDEVKGSISLIMSNVTSLSDAVRLCDCVAFLKNKKRWLNDFDFSSPVVIEPLFSQDDLQRGKAKMIINHLLNFGFSNITVNIDALTISSRSFFDEIHAAMPELRPIFFNFSKTSEYVDEWFDECDIEPEGVCSEDDPQTNERQELLLHMDWY
eukprot:GDKJ01014739.1.p1 GENE.GDKJ01014739.1~~GDKJ01014739.1.p1  ORF type:complete len:729 (+),score=134.86 GDKJ01014739.1:1-2187(+)